MDVLPIVKQGVETWADIIINSVMQEGQEVLLNYIVNMAKENYEDPWYKWITSLIVGPRNEDIKKLKVALQANVPEHRLCGLAVFLSEGGYETSSMNTFLLLRLLETYGHPPITAKQIPQLTLTLQSLAAEFRRKLCENNLVEQRHAAWVFKNQEYHKQELAQTRMTQETFKFRQAELGSTPLFKCPKSDEIKQLRVHKVMTSNEAPVETTRDILPLFTDPASITKLKYIENFNEMVPSEQGDYYVATKEQDQYAIYYVDHLRRILRAQGSAFKSCYDYLHNLHFDPKKIQHLFELQTLLRKCSPPTLRVNACFADYVNFCLSKGSGFPPLTKVVVQEEAPLVYSDAAQFVCTNEETEWAIYFTNSEQITRLNLDEYPETKDLLLKWGGLASELDDPQLSHLAFTLRSFVTPKMTAVLHNANQEWTNVLSNKPQKVVIPDAVRELFEKRSKNLVNGEDARIIEPTLPEAPPKIGQVVIPKTIELFFQAKSVPKEQPQNIPPILG